MKQEMEDYIAYISETKQVSENTMASYGQDLKKLAGFLAMSNVTDLGKVTATNLTSYVLFLERQGMAPASISRHIASVKSFFRYLTLKGVIDSNPSEILKGPRIEKHTPDILSVKDIQILLEQPHADTPKELRDKAMLELMYATGIRVTELITMKLADLNMQMGFVICHDETRERIIPFGLPCKKALNAYLSRARQLLLKGSDDGLLFTNCAGGQMSRQGFWKLIKTYAEKAGIRAEITPHVLRHSFAAHLVDNGADLRIVQEMMGHSDISSTQVYVNMRLQKMRATYDRSHPRI